MTDEQIKAAMTQDAPIDSASAEQLLSHLTDENQSMAAMLTAVRDVHYSLLVLDDEALKRSLEAESRELNSNAALQIQRRQIQADLAKKLELEPHDATVRRLVNLTAGPQRDSLEQILKSLAEMATEVDRLNRQNAAMIGQSLAIARGVIEQLTGSAAIHESYNSVGGRMDSHVGPLVQWGG